MLMYLLKVNTLVDISIINDDKGMFQLLNFFIVANKSFFENLPALKKVVLNVMVTIVASSMLNIN